MSVSCQFPPFQRKIREHGLTLSRRKPAILQLNTGKLCNLTCVHCHVNAGPRRKEIMQRETVDRIVDWFARTDIPVLDLTGGTPEMIPDFRYLIGRVKELSPARHIIDRCNVTIMKEPGFEWVGPFLAENQIEVVASMPCYSPENVNAQRGEGVFDRSIAALQELNALGYGRGDERLPLHLVYNPNGAVLPPAQDELEVDYKRELARHFGITFDRLYVLANLPIARFASYLRRNGKYEEYLSLLVEAFNPATVEHLMCRDTISVSWTGEVFDCDFNQMLDMAWSAQGRRLKLWELDASGLEGRSIATGAHCYGCTAGSGSSCGGSLV